MVARPFEAGHLLDDLHAGVAQPKLCRPFMSTACSHDLAKINQSFKGQRAAGAREQPGGVAWQPGHLPEWGDQSRLVSVFQATWKHGANKKSVRQPSPASAASPGSGSCACQSARAALLAGDDGHGTPSLVCPCLGKPYDCVSSGMTERQSMDFLGVKELIQ